MIESKSLDRIVDKLIPKEVLPSVLGDRVEKEIKKLIEKWEHREGWTSDYAAQLALADFRDLLEFKQKNCCEKPVEGK